MPTVVGQLLDGKRDAVIAAFLEIALGMTGEENNIPPDLPVN